MTLATSIVTATHYAQGVGTGVEGYCRGGYVQMPTLRLTFILLGPLVLIWGVLSSRDMTPVTDGLCCCFLFSRLLLLSE